MSTITAKWNHSYNIDCFPNFSVNMEQPRHRWYDFKEGFSSTLVARAINETRRNSQSLIVFDPFSGSETSPLTALQCNCDAIGFEVNPFMSFVAKTKCKQSLKTVQEYYRELRHILSQRPFRRNSSLECSCGVHSQIWKDKNKRELIQKPERFMRDSLWQYLQSSLRNHTVKREQVVDATHPVDIKMIWPNISNVALIEVKWLGDSGQTKYRDARANEGAQQLIDYLVSSVQEEPDKHFVGFLAVFDGRRGKTNNQYELQEINYNPEFISHPYMKFRRFYMAESIV